MIKKLTVILLLLMGCGGTEYVTQAAYQHDQESLLGLVQEYRQAEEQCRQLGVSASIHLLQCALSTDLVYCNAYASEAEFYNAQCINDNDNDSQ